MPQCVIVISSPLNLDTNIAECIMTKFLYLRHCKKKTLLKREVINYQHENLGRGKRGDYSTRAPLDGIVTLELIDILTAKDGHMTNCS